MSRTDWAVCWFPRCDKPAVADCILCEEPTCAAHAPKHHAVRQREAA